MRQLHPHRPRQAPGRQRSHHGGVPTRRRPSGQLIFDGVVAGYIHDISPRGIGSSHAFQRAPRRLAVDG